MLEAEKAAGVCDIRAELLKAGGKAITCWIACRLAAVWQFSDIFPDWERDLAVPVWREEGDRQDCKNYQGITLVRVTGKVVVHLLFVEIHSQLLKLLLPMMQ